MIQEFLVILACTQNAGCSQTTTSYYQAHPEIKQMAKSANNKVEQAIGPEIVFLSPALILAGTGKGTFNVNKYLSVQISGKAEKMILFKLTF